MRVGVILAARAPVPYLAEALDSVLSQEPAPDRVVLVDHASEPALGEVAGVELIRLGDPSGGPAAARAAGLAALDTELIALADADDVWEPRKLGVQLEALAAHPRAAVCFGRAAVIDAAGRRTGERLPELPAGILRAADLQRELYVRNAIPASSTVIRREGLDAVGGFIPGEPLPAGTDWDLWLRLVAAGTDFVCEPAARIRYRRHDGGLTANIARLAESGLAIHERHAGLVDSETATHARATDLETLARGRIRERRYDEAKSALTAAAAVRPPATRERLLKLAVATPVARTLLGRRTPYR
jgi:glycosyltransferase involved in cell wall biosynthesis